MELLPDEVYEQRIRKSMETHKRKERHTSEKFKFLSRFNCIITNVSVDVLPIEIVPVLYKMRWQVELIFYGKQIIMQSGIIKHACNQAVNAFTLQYHFA